MYISESSYTIAEMDLQYVAGRKAIAGGSIELAFSMRWTEYARNRRVLDGSLTLSIPEHGQFLTYRLENRLEETRQDRTNSRLYFVAHVPFSVLEAVEKIRLGKDLLVTGDIRLFTDDGRAFRERTASAQPANETPSNYLWADQISFSISAQDWLKALDGMGFRRSIIIEAIFPYASGGSDPLSVRLVRARDAFDGGRYESCVAEIRHVLAELDSRRGDTSAVGDAIGKFRNTAKDVREGMSLTERILVLRRTLEHIAHFAHHPGEEEFERASAKIALVLMASILEYFPEPSAAS